MFNASQPSAARSVTHSFCRGYGGLAHWKITSPGNFPARAGLASWPCTCVPLMWSIVIVAYSTPGLSLGLGVRTGWGGTDCSSLIFELQKLSKSAGRGRDG